MFNDGVFEKKVRKIFFNLGALDKNSKYIFKTKKSLKKFVLDKKSEKSIQNQKPF